MTHADFITRRYAFAVLEAIFEATPGSKAVKARDRAQRAARQRSFDLVMRRARNLLATLKLSGPHQTWPRWQVQGPSRIGFQNGRLLMGQRAAAIEWLSTQMSREAAIREWEDNDRGHVH